MMRPHTSAYAAHAERFTTGLRYRSTLRLSFPAKVRRKASARSGERMPRFFMSALLSTTILPVEVKAYVGEVSSAISASSFGIEQARSWNHSRPLNQSSSLRRPQFSREALLHLH